MIAHGCRLLLIVVLFIGSTDSITPNPASAQFAYLDCNGDGVNSMADSLSDPVPTLVDIWLDTSHDRGGNDIVCDSGPERLSLASYEVVLHATGGTVAYGTYSNAQPTMTTSFGQASNDMDFYVGFGGAIILNPGLYRLGSVMVTVVEGSPSLGIATSTTLGPVMGTSFGTQCTGHDNDNTYKLGSDWLDVSGCGAPSGANSHPFASVPAHLHAEPLDAVTITGAFADHDTADAIAVTVAGAPPGLVPVVGRQLDGAREVRLYGVLKPASTDTTYALRWSAGDGQSSEVSSTALKIESSPQDGIESLVRNMVQRDYEHGMPRLPARRLGGRALPILASMLRSEEMKPYWLNAAAAIGYVGDTAYFDTLRNFVWNRFSGEVDLQTFKAICMAQLSMAIMASTSSNVLDYLEQCVDPNYWRPLRWYIPSRTGRDLWVEMSGITLVALGYTDSDRAEQILTQARSQPQDPKLVGVVREALDRIGRIRGRGIEKQWDAEDSPPR